MRRFLLTAAALCLIVPTALVDTASAGDSITLNPTRDNTLYEFGGGQTSNSKGKWIFAGTGFITFPEKLKRAIFYFDVASAVPPGATITSARLELKNTKTRDSAPRNFFLHRITTDWTEGNSVATGNEGIAIAATDLDATWTHTSYRDVTWTNPGGDFEATESAQAAVSHVLNSIGTFTSAQMATDVQSWIDTPETNFGWLIKGEELDGDGWATRRWASVDNPTANDRPKLILEFTSATDLTCRLSRVNAGAGTPTDVLTVNGSIGDANREVIVGLNESIAVDMIASPAGPEPGPFVTYLWFGEPSPSTVTPLPKNLGNICFPLLVTGGNPQPTKTWNNIGRQNKLGVPDFPSTPAPSSLVNAPGGWPSAATATLQGIILDDGSAADAPASVTNAVILKIQ